MPIQLCSLLITNVKYFQAEQRKYHQGHKEFLAPYTKAVNCLEKFNKKNQSKGVYDEAKEAPVCAVCLPVETMYKYIDTWSVKYQQRASIVKHRNSTKELLGVNAGRPRVGADKIYKTFLGVLFS